MALKTLSGQSGLRRRNSHVGLTSSFLCHFVHLYIQIKSWVDICRYSFTFNLLPSKHNTYLYIICTMLDQRRRRWADVVQMLCKYCFVFAGCMILKLQHILLLIFLRNVTASKLSHFWIGLESVLSGSFIDQPCFTNR